MLSCYEAAKLRVDATLGFQGVGSESFELLEFVRPRCLWGLSQRVRGGGGGANMTADALALELSKGITQATKA